MVTENKITTTLSLSKSFGKLFLHELVYGGHLLSFGAASIVWSTLILIGSDGVILIYITYLISQITYNYDHLKDKENSVSTNIERTKHLSRSRIYQYVMLSIYIILFLIISMFVSLSVFLLSVSLILGGILYTNKLKYLTKILIGFKSVYVSFFWGLIVFLPMYHLEIKLSPFFILFFIFVFLRLLVSTIFFDIKDITSDSKKKLKTLPVVLGVKKSILTMHLLNIITGLIIITGVVNNVFSTQSLFLLVLIPYSFYYLWKARDANDAEIRKLSYIVVDGEFFLWPIILIIGNLLLLSL